MKWKEDEVVSEEVYQRAKFDLDVARRLYRLENPKIPPYKPVSPPCYLVGYGVVISLELAVELRKFNIPKPEIKKKGWFKLGK